MMVRAKQKTKVEKASPALGKARLVPKQAAPKGPRRWGLLERLGLYEIGQEPITISTRQAEALNPALVGTTSDDTGAPFGTDVETGKKINLSPHQLHAEHRIDAPNVVIIGDVNTGKTSAGICQFCARQLPLGTQIVVFDRKLYSGGDSEYGPLSEVAQGTTIRFAREGGARVNVLDPRIARLGRKGGSDARVGQDDLLKMVAEQAHGRALNSEERHALTAAHKKALRVAAEQQRVPILNDVVDALYDPDETAVPRPHLAESVDGAEPIVTTATVTQWGLRLAMSLDQFIDGDLSGLIDGETCDENGNELNLSNQLIVIDTSELDEGSPALGLVMAIMSTFLSGVWAREPGQRIILIEEGYHTASIPAVARVFRALAKRGRGIGLSLVSVFHHLSDVSSTEDASALIREAGLVMVYRQDRASDAKDAMEMFRLPDWCEETLTSLEVGTCFVKIGIEAPRIVNHIRTELEEELTDTSQVMENRERLGRAKERAA